MVAHEGKKKIIYIYLYKYTVTPSSTVLPLLRPKQSEAARGFCLWLCDWFG